MPPPTRTTSSPAQSRASIGRGPVPDAATLEISELSQRETAIFGPAGDDHGPRLNASAAFDIERQRAVRPRAIERLDGGRNHHFGAELLRLDEGAGGQVLPRNSGRESKIVLDPGARAGLPAKGARIENDDGKPLGRRVDGGRKAGRTGADDREVIDETFARAVDHAQLPRKLGLCRIAEHRAVGTNHQRQRARETGAVGDEFACFVVLGIEQMMGIGVAEEKILQPDDGP